MDFECMKLIDGTFKNIKIKDLKKGDLIKTNSSKTDRSYSIIHDSYLIVISVSNGYEKKPIFTARGLTPEEMLKVSEIERMEINE